MDDETAPPPQEDPGSADAGLGGATEISRRVGSILDAVEREAQRLRAEAREEAARYLEDAKRRADGLVAERQLRIAELSNELIIKSEAVVARLDDAAPVRQGFENLVRALGDAAERLSRETELLNADFQPQSLYETPAQPSGYPPTPYAPVDQAPPQPHPARASSTPEWDPPPPAAPSGYAPRASAGWRQLDEARVVAIQMASGGSTRAAVREHLTGVLGVADASAILDEIFGAGTGEYAQVPWTDEPR